MESSMEWVFPKDFIFNPRGESVEGDSIAKDRTHRSYTVWFLEDLSKALNMDRRVLYTASVFFHRFFLFHSFETQNRFHVAVACLFLAGKVEERTFKLKDVVHGYFAVRWPKGRPAEEQAIKEMCKQVVLAERLVLHALNFDINLVHPYTILLGKMKDLKSFISEDSRKDLLQTSVNYLNDTYRSTFCLQYTPLEIAMAVFYLATLTVSVAPINPNPRVHVVEPTWVALVSRDIDESRLRSLCLEVLEMYETLAMQGPGQDASSKKLECQRVASQVMAEIALQENNNNNHSKVHSLSHSSSHLSLATTVVHEGELVTDSESLNTPAAQYNGSYGMAMGEEEAPQQESEYVVVPSSSSVQRAPTVTVTRMPSSAGKLMREVSGTSVTAYGGHSQRGADSTYSTSEDGYEGQFSDLAQMDETPVYSVGGFSALRGESEGSDTPSFRDLVQQPGSVRVVGRQRSRSNSLTTDYVDTKRSRTE